jgi:hypothetical protein
MIVSKLNLAVFAAAVGGLVWVEHAHRIRIEAPTPVEVAQRNGACPENESVPFSLECMTFIQGGTGPSLHLRVNGPDGVSPDLPPSPELP